MQRINFKTIYDQIKNRPKSSSNNNQNDISNFFYFIDSQLKQIENECALSNTLPINGNQEIPDHISELFHRLQSMPVKIKYIIDYINAYTAKEKLNKDDETLLDDIKKTLNESIIMVQNEIKHRTVTHVNNHIDTTFGPMYTLCNALGGVHIKICQSYDPLKGHAKENDQLKPCPGICAGLVFEWAEICAKQGEIKAPLIGTVDVLKKHTNQKTEQTTKSEQTIRFNSQEFEDNIDKVLKNLSSKPLYISIGHTKASAGHAWGLRKRADDSYEFFDPNSGYFYFPNLKTFTFWFKEYFHYHQAAQVLGFGIEYIRFDVLKDKSKSLNRYFPEVNEYTENIISFSPHERSKQLTSTLTNTILKADDIINSNEYKEDEKITIIIAILKDYLDFISSGIDLKTIKDLLDLLCGDITNPSFEQLLMLSCYKNIAEFAKNNTGFKKVLADIRDQYKQKVEQVKNQPKSLGDEESQLIKEYMDLKKYYKELIQRLAENANQKNDYFMALSLLSHKLIRLEKLQLAKKLKSNDVSLNFHYSIDKAKHDLKSVLPNYEEIAKKPLKTSLEDYFNYNVTNPAALNDCLICLLNRSATYLEADISSNETDFITYRENQNKIRILIKCSEVLTKLNQLSRAKEISREKIKKCFDSHSTDQGLELIEKVMTDQKTFVSELEKLSEDFDFISSFIGVRMHDISEPQLKRISALFNPVLSKTRNQSISRDISLGLLELKTIIYLYFSAENNDDLSSQGLGQLFLQVFGVDLLNDPSPVEDIISQLDEYKMPLMGLTKNWKKNTLDKTDLPLHSIFEHRINLTYENIEKCLSAYQQDGNFKKFVNIMQQLAPGLTNNIYHKNVRSEKSFDYFVLDANDKKTLETDMLSSYELLKKMLEDAKAEVTKLYDFPNFKTKAGEYFDQKQNELDNIARTANEEIQKAVNIAGATRAIIKYKESLTQSVNKLSENENNNNKVTLQFDKDNALVIANQLTLTKQIIEVTTNSVADTIIQNKNDLIQKIIACSQDILDNIYRPLLLELAKQFPSASVNNALDTYQKETMASIYQITRKATRDINSSKNMAEIDKILCIYKNSLSDFVKKILVSDQAPIVFDNDTPMLENNYRSQLTNKIKANLYQLINKAQLQPLSNVDIVVLMQKDFERLKNTAHGNSITNFFSINSRPFVTGHLKEIKSTLESDKLTAVNKIQDAANQFSLYADKISLLRHPAKQIHAETWSDPRLAANAKHTLQLIIHYFYEQEWQVSEFSLRNLTIDVNFPNGSKKTITLPRNAAEIVNLYTKAMNSEISWQNALYEVETILANNYQPDAKEATWGKQRRRYTTQQAYNHAFELIQEDFHAKLQFSKVDFNDLLQKSKALIENVDNCDKKIKPHVIKLIDNALATLQSDSLCAKYRTYQVIQSLTKLLYDQAQNIPWYSWNNKGNSDLYKAIIHLVAQCNGFVSRNNRPFTSDQEREYIDAFMKSEKDFFTARLKSCNLEKLETRVPNVSNNRK